MTNRLGLILILFVFWYRRRQSSLWGKARQGMGIGTIRGHEGYSCYNYYRRLTGRKGVVSSEYPGAQVETLYVLLEVRRWIRTLIHSVSLVLHNIINTFYMQLSLLFCRSRNMPRSIQKWGKLLVRDFGTFASTRLEA
jgi:hypothetical protein